MKKTLSIGFSDYKRYVTEDLYRIRIPNKEIGNVFKSLTALFLNVSYSMLYDMLYALTKLNDRKFLENYRSLLEQLPSSHDLLTENSYHMLLLGICAWLRHEYEIKSNREEGLGRYDIILKSKSHKPSYVIEFKYTDNENKLQALASVAIQQIIDRKYDCDLTGQVIYIGLAHAGKVVEMQWVERK